MMKFQVQDPHFLPHSGIDLTFELGEGELLVLTGENGIGKTTLLNRLYSKLPGPQRVLVEQKATEYFYDRKLGVLKKLFLEAHPPGLVLEDFQFLWNTFGLNHKEDRLVSQLSGGETQCVKLSLALCRDVQVYFIDEPSQYLDKNRKEILDNFLNKLIQRKKSILMIEHNRDWIGSFSHLELKIQDNVLMRAV